MAITQKLIERNCEYKTICIGFDQSYTKTGIAVAGMTNKGDIEILHCESVPGIGNIQNSKLMYRRKLQERIYWIYRNFRAYGDRCYAISEEIRVHSDGNMLVNNHLSWGALQGCIADYLWQNYNLTLHVVDTRAWKSKVVGTSKPATNYPNGVDPKKWPTIQYVMHELDVDKSLITQKLGTKTKKYTWIDKEGNKCTYDSDICDACCIANYGLLVPLNKLKQCP